MPGMPGGGQMDPAMMQQMMNNPMVQQVRLEEQGGGRGYRLEQMRGPNSMA